MTAYDFVVKGCDAATRLFAVELSDLDAALLSRIVGQVNEAATEGCQPEIECFHDFGPDDEIGRDRYGEWCHAACLVVTAS